MPQLQRAGLALASALLLLAAAGTAAAQVRPDMAARIKAIGPVVDPPSTALLYGPLQPKPPYPGVAVARDLSYGPDARNVLDVFSAEGAAGGRRPVLIYVPGGAGNKIEPVPMGSPFYDNVMLWAVKHGMVGVNMQRHASFQPWDVGARDIAQTIAWVKQNIARYGGDPDRVFIWGHSAGAMNLSTYLSHPALYPQGGVGVRGAVLMAGPYNLAPLTIQAPPIQIRMGMNAPAGPPGPPPGAPRAGGPPPPGLPMGQESSALEGLKALGVPLLVSVAELDPPMLVESARVLNEQLCKAGKCPTYVVYKDHGHMSEIFAVNTDDVSTSQPVLDWMAKVR